MSSSISSCNTVMSRSRSRSRESIPHASIGGKWLVTVGKVKNDVMRIGLIGDFASAADCPN